MSRQKRRGSSRYFTIIDPHSLIELRIPRSLDSTQGEHYPDICELPQRHLSRLRIVHKVKSGGKNGSVDTWNSGDVSQQKAYGKGDAPYEILPKCRPANKDLSNHKSVEYTAPSDERDIVCK